MSEENENNEGVNELETMRAALDKYKTENKKFREQRDEYKSQIEKGISNDESLSKFKTRTLKAEAKLRLQELGIKDSERLAKYIDLDKVSINDDDELEGLDDQITSLKTDFPELFDAKRRVAGLADGGVGNGAAPRTQGDTSSNLQARLMLGQK